MDEGKEMTTETKHSITLYIPGRKPAVHEASDWTCKDGLLHWADADSGKSYDTNLPFLIEHRAATAQPAPSAPARPQEKTFGPPVSRSSDNWME